MNYRGIHLFSFWQKTGALDRRFAALALAVIVYAAFGTPTPDAPGAVEIIIGALLVFAAGASVFQVFKFSAGESLFLAAGRILLLFGLSVPLLAGVMRGNAPMLILRDIIPFLFLVLPVFLSDLFVHNSNLFKPFLKLCVAAGLIFSARSAADVYGWLMPGELNYFANAPTVLFAALALIGFGARNFVTRFSKKDFVAMLAGFALAALPLAAMALALQRASIGAAVVYGALLLVLGMARAPYRTIFVAGIVVAALLGPVYQTADTLFTQLGNKTVEVGFNNRFEETGAVWHQIAGDPLSLLVGEGWGGTLESPAVGGVRVNYTHSLLSSLLLKAGLGGLALGLFYLGALGRALVGVILARPVLGLALAAPFLIDVFLYASFKSLDFGLILLLIAAARLHESYQKCM